MGDTLGGSCTVGLSHRRELKYGGRIRAAWFPVSPLKTGAGIFILARASVRGMWSPALTAMYRAHTSIEFNISLSLTGELVTARRLNEKAQAFAAPSTPEVESRSSAITPFPIADSLKYLMQREQNGNLDS